MFKQQTPGHTISFRETQMPMNQRLLVQLTNVDSARLFGIVLCSQSSRRAEFIRRFHMWHRENRASLELLVSDKNAPPIGNYSSLVFSPCTVHSVMHAQWSRGIVLNCDPTSKSAVVYLVDYCKTAGTTVDRLFKY